MISNHVRDTLVSYIREDLDLHQRTGNSSYFLQAWDHAVGDFELQKYISHHKGIALDQLQFLNYGNWVEYGFSFLRKSDLSLCLAQSFQNTKIDIRCVGNCDVLERVFQDICFSILSARYPDYPDTIRTLVYRECCRVSFRQACESFLEIHLASSPFYFYTLMKDSVNHLDYFCVACDLIRMFFLDDWNYPILFRSDLLPKSQFLIHICLLLCLRDCIDQRYRELSVRSFFPLDNLSEIQIISFFPLVGAT